VTTGVRDVIGLMDYRVADCIGYWYRHAIIMEQTMEEMMGSLVAEVNALLKAGHEEMISKMEFIAPRMYVNQGKSDADLKEMKEEMKAKLDSNREEVKAI
jgi:hypothetical protein